MAVIVQQRYSETVHPLHAVMLAGMLPLFLGAFISDLAYANTFEIQWSNFASWLIVGGLIVGAITLVFALVDLATPRRRARGFPLYLLFVLATWIVAFFNALMHARDAWAMMPGGLILSALTTLLAALATWMGFHASRVVRRVV